LIKKKLEGKEILKYSLHTQKIQGSPYLLLCSFLLKWKKIIQFFNKAQLEDQ